MEISRRNFVKGVAGGGLLLATGVPTVEAAMSKELPPQAVGLLYDATLCVGCKACMVNCKKANSVPGGALYSSRQQGVPYEKNHLPPGDMVWDAPTDLSGQTLSIVKAYRHGSAETKDQAENGYAYFKQQCLHCITPSCASVCPAGAFRKDPENGVVYYLEEKCIGCRYCQLACPFGVPRYEWQSAWPAVRKCQLCNHRYQEGKYSACAETCPTGATIFGQVTKLREEAQRRLTLEPGSEYAFPLQRVDANERVQRLVSRYEGVFGLKEAGGTQNLLLSGISFDLLGFAGNIPDSALPDLTWAYIAKIPWVFAGVFLGGTALYQITHRKDKGDKS